MTATPYKTANSERIGRGLGRAWRTLLRADARLATWMIGHGLSPGIARVLLWTLKLGLISLLAFIALWLAVVFAVAVIAAHAVRSGAAVPARSVFDPSESTDHRQHLFYDPIAYNDDPDPRFSDPRFPDA